MQGTVERRAIIIPSIGDRPWGRASHETFICYAARHGFDVHLETTEPSPDEFPFPTLPDSPGRPNKRVYALKTFFAWNYLANRGYDRVAVVDDTCCVRPDAPSIFDHVPHGACGFTGTSVKSARRSFAVIDAFTGERKLSPIPHVPLDYPNSGVMVYDRTMVDALSPQQIWDCSPLLMAPYPHQTLIYYLLKRHHIPMHKVDKRFNKTPASSSDRQYKHSLRDLSDAVDNVFIIHLTGAYWHRAELVAQARDIFLCRASLAPATDDY